MYDPSDPRAALASNQSGTANVASEYAGAEYVKFSETPPQENDSAGRTWYGRAQNFLVAYTQANSGAVLSRSAQPDEYIVLLPDAHTRIEVSTPREQVEVAPQSFVVVPPGDSNIRVPDGGRVFRIFTAKAEDLLGKCSNAASYAQPHPNVAPHRPWPDPVGGFRVRAYTMNVAPEHMRHGRMWRCTNFLVYVSAPRIGPRDVTKLSPHYHDDFEQATLNLEGDVVHHIRWPWTTNKNVWRPDEHELCRRTALTVIPPRAIHTTEHISEGVNIECVIYCPPRLDWARHPDWVRNGDDYPMPPDLP